MKRLILIILMILVMLGGGVVTSYGEKMETLVGAEVISVGLEGQTCTMPVGIEVCQVMNTPWQPLGKVTVPQEETVKVTGNISEFHLNVIKNSEMEGWENAVYVEFDFDFGEETGVLTLTVIVKPEDLKDCK